MPSIIGAGISFQKVVRSYIPSRQTDLQERGCDKANGFAPTCVKGFCISR
mgnify:FL=1